MFKRYLYRLYNAPDRQIRRRVTMSGWMILGAIAVSAAQGVDTGASLAYQAFAFLFGLAIVSGISVFFVGKRVSIERVFPKFGSAGESLSYTLIVRNNSRRRLRSIALIEQMPNPRPSCEQFLEHPEPGEEKRNWFDRTFVFYRWRWLMDQNIRARVQELPLPELPPGASREIKVDLLPLKRGVLRLTGATIANPEPFGLFRALRYVPAPQSALILPKRYRVPPLELPGTLKYQQGGVSLASSVGESEEFVSLREYRPGDPLRRLHWKSFAKAGKPVVKEFQDEFFVRHALILDTFTKELSSQIFEEVVSVAASLACTIQEHDSLLDLMFVGPQAYCFTTGRGIAHTEQMLEILASVQTCQDKEFKSLCSMVAGHVAHISGCLCVFMDWDEPRQELVKILKSRNVPLRVFVITKGEAPLEPGVMVDQPENFHSLPMSKIAERLAAL